MILFLIKTWLNSGLFGTYGNTPDEIHAVKLQKTDKKKSFWCVGGACVSKSQKCRIFFTLRVFPFKLSTWSPRNLHLCGDPANGKVFISKSAALCGTLLRGWSRLFVSGFIYYLIFREVFNMNNRNVTLMLLPLILFMNK